MSGRILAAAFCAASLVTSTALAGTVVISQKDKTFSQDNVSLKVGDSISFVNDDNITHNVYSRSKGHRFDIGAQQPGSAEEHQFSAPGEVKVRCAIHPRMKLTVNVE